MCVFAKNERNIRVCNLVNDSISVDIRAYGDCENHAGPVKHGLKNCIEWSIGGCDANVKVWFTSDQYATFGTWGKGDYVFTAYKDDHGYVGNVNKSGDSVTRVVRATIEK